MRAPNKQQLCDCKCGVMEFPNRLKLIELETADDETLGRTTVAKRFWVREECREDFVRELQAMKLLSDYVRRHTGSPWWRRAWYVRRIIRLQHLINLRHLGLEATKQKAIRSGLLFAAPHWIGGWIEYYWRWADCNQLEYRWKLDHQSWCTVWIIAWSVIGVAALTALVVWG